MRRFILSIIIIVISIPILSFGNIIELKEAVKLSLTRNMDIQNAIIGYKQNNLDEIKTLSMYIPQFGLNWTKSSINEPNVGQSFSSYPIDSKSLSPYISFLTPGGGNLTLQYNSDYSHSNPFSFSGFTPSADSYTKKYSISFTQPILQNFLLIPYDINIIKMAKSSKRIAKLTILQASENIAYQTANMYINIFINQLNLTVKRNSLSRAKLLLKRNIKNSRLGIVEDTDILASKASIQIRSADVSLSKNQIASLKNQLKTLISTTNNIEISTNIDLANIEFNTNFSFNKILQEALHNRADLQILYAQKRIQKLNLMNTKSKLLPNVSLFGSYSFYGNASTEDAANKVLSNGENKSWTFGINLSYPLYPLSPISEIKKEKLELEKIDNNIKKKRLEIKNNLKSRINDIKADISRLKLLEKAIKQQRDKLSLEEKKYKTGKSSTRIILQYQDDLENAETQYLNVRLHYYLSVLALKYEMGIFLKSFCPEYYKNIERM